MTTMTDDQKAREYGTRAAKHLRTIERAGVIEAGQQLPCLSAYEWRHQLQQAWINAKLAAHHGLRALSGDGQVRP